MNYGYNTFHNIEYMIIGQPEVTSSPPHEVRRTPNLLNRQVIGNRAAELFGTNLDRIVERGDSANGPIRITVRRDAFSGSDNQWIDHRFKANVASARVNGYTVAEVIDYEPREGKPISDDEAKVVRAVTLKGEDDKGQPVVVEFRLKQRGNSPDQTVEYLFQSGGAYSNYREGDPRGCPITEDEQRRIASIVGIPVG